MMTAVIGLNCMLALPPNERLAKNCSISSVMLSSLMGIDTLVWVFVGLKVSCWVTCEKSPPANAERKRQKLNDSM